MNRKKDGVFPNLRAEMARRNVTITDLANVLDLRIATVSIKLKTGKFTLREAKIIKGYLNVEMSLEELFEEAV
jgi:hypothetical protein